MINDFYYTAVINQQGQELRELARQNRLADEARRVRRQRRAVERENRLLERAVNGQVDRWGQLADLFRIGRLRRDRRRAGANSTHLTRSGAGRQSAGPRVEAPSDHC